MSEGKCPNCGGPTVTENFTEATITRGPCGYVWASHFGGGAPQTEPCRKPASSGDGATPKSEKEEE